MPADGKHWHVTPRRSPRKSTNAICAGGENRLDAIQRNVRTVRKPNFCERRDDWLVAACAQQRSRSLCIVAWPGDEDTHLARQQPLHSARLQVQAGFATYRGRLRLWIVGEHALKSYFSRAT